MDTIYYATHIVSKLREAGYIAYFAGGWVRDYILGCPSDDIDIATDAPPEKVQAIFPKTIPVGESFGVVIVVMEALSFEVASFRADGLYIDGRRPTGIRFSTPEEDAQRRDFTINGMFYDPIQKQILDFVEGQEDLKKKIIRAIGNPSQRFEEDRLRMIRGVRLAARFQFEIDPETEKAIATKASSLFPSVAVERVWQELVKMAKFPHFPQGLLHLHQLNLLQTIFPSLLNLPITEIQRRLSPLSRYPQEAPTILMISALFPKATQQELLDLCTYLKLSKDEMNWCETLAKTRESLSKNNTNPLEPIEWAYLYANRKISTVLKIISADLPEKQARMFLEEHSKRQKQLRTHIERISMKKPLVTSSHLKSQSIPPGPEMGKLLREAETLSVNLNLNDPQEVIEELKKRNRLF